MNRSVSALFTALLVACSSAGGVDPEANPGSSASGGTEGDAGSAGAGNQGGHENNEGGKGGNDPVELGGQGGIEIGKTASLTGTVHAPEGTIPISGALVYLAKSDPPTIPTGVYCDTCVQLSASTPYTLSNADGTFDLKAAPGEYRLIVQKGAFRRVRPITLVDGAQQASAEATRFPGKSGNGDNIPHMVITRADGWDKIPDTLKKLGITEFDVRKDKFAFPPDPHDPDTMLGLLHTYEQLAKYHLVFIPCQGMTTCDQNLDAATSEVRGNIQKYVAAGGRIYSTDYMYDYVAQPFPGFIDWAEGPQEEGESYKKHGDPGYACLLGDATRAAVVNDSGLSAWLTGLGFSSFNLYRSYTDIVSTSTKQGLGPDGQTTSITPKVWVSNDLQHPATVSFEHGCGRAMFSTYHTEDKAVDASVPRVAGLLAQELALLYIILQVNVCVGSEEGVIIK